MFRFLWCLPSFIGLVFLGEWRFAATKVADPDGEQLAKLVCAGCHLYPEPSLLPKNTWKEIVLPQMGYRFGIYPNDTFRTSLLARHLGGELVESAGIFPATQTLEEVHWEKICQFYYQNAPDSLPEIPFIPVKIPLAQFSTTIPSLKLSPPSTTLIRFEKNGGLQLGDANSERLYWLDTALQMITAATLGESVVDTKPGKNGLLLTIMGSFSPTDAPTGILVYLDTKNKRGELILENLQRPVNSNFADFNGDGSMDIVVCEYAKWTGGLTLWLQNKSGGFDKTILRKQPGAIKTFIRDLNGDGFWDILALFGQGDEGIFKYINNGKGAFEETAVVRFPPTYGSSNIRLIDINGDSLEDIVYTCGDNADYKPIQKPYHGIYFYLNEGNGKFKQSFFYPLPGAYDAIPTDFDGDGDLDIAAISFFPDFGQQPVRSFLYLENKGNWELEAQTFPEVNAGRWIVMDAGDLEGDGDWDIALGALAFEVVPDRGEINRWVADGIPFVVLKNKFK